MYPHHRKGVGGGFHFKNYIIDCEYITSLRPLSMERGLEGDGIVRVVRDRSFRVLAPSVWLIQDSVAVISGTLQNDQTFRNR